MFSRRLNQSRPLRLCFTAAITFILMFCLTGCEGHNSDNLFFKTESSQRHTQSAEILSGVPCEHPLPS